MPVRAVVVTAACKPCSVVAFCVETREGQLGGRSKLLGLIGFRKAISPLARAVLVLTLAAFTLQSFIIQAHIHLAKSDEAALTGTARVDQSAHPTAGKVSFHALVRRGSGTPFDDPDKCPLCQEYLYAGNYLPPAAFVLHVPTVNVSEIAPKTPILARTWVVSHSWHGRAPPAV